MSRFIIKAAILGVAFVPLLAGAGQIIALEATTGDLQSRAIARYAKDLRFTVEDGPSATIRFPASGPYDARLGYTGLGSYIKALTANGYEVTRQARPTPELAGFVEQIGYAPYREKSSGGLAVFDRQWRPIYAKRYPERLYADFESVPRVIVDTLLFIENRELLDESNPNRNPTVEWDRFAAAAVGVVARTINPETKIFGGSTLATQLEKFRHSPEGRTSHPLEKLRQIASGSVRAYLDGPNTLAARERIVVDYLNSTPLGARNGHGEVHGVGDGLYVWYSLSFAEANRILRAPAEDEETLARKALVYKQAMSLLLAQRRPAYYFANPKALETLANSYLRLMAAQGVIDEDLRDAALRTPLAQGGENPAAASTFLERKAANAVRNHMLSLMQVPSLYALDRIDLEVRSTFDAQAQETATALLRQLDDRAFLQANGLGGARLMDRGDPARVEYSVTIMERGPDANYVRIQADNRDQPLDLNEGVKLDLGSTAKLRTLITYLEIFAELHGRYAQSNAEELAEVANEASDELTRWTARYFAGTSDRSLPTLLDAAMARRYSASTAEQFFTGGGLHSFANFERSDEGKVMTVSEGLRRSVNLVFIRVMRDVVKYYMAEGPQRASELLQDRSHPSRQDYLARFADSEGSEILSQLYRRYRGQNADQALATLAGRVRATADRLAVAFRSVRPKSAPDELSQFLAAHLAAPHPEVDAVAKLYDKYGPDRFNLADRGYLARIHPLELWLVAYLQTKPGATRAEILAASAEERQSAYAWLFRTRHKSAQDVRIRILLEEEAFARIHESWKRLGFPFDSLVPSLATAIGSSADKPSALAELMGIIVNEGIKQPTLRVDRLHFAAGTPYETLLDAKPAARERVLAPEIAQTVRRALIDVVENGTARRAYNAFSFDGKTLVVGGKTGTGDHRFDRYGPGGKLIDSRVVERNAVFVFFIGDRFFGTVAVHVGGPEAGNYDFTSGLATQILKMMGPALAPLLAPPPPTTPIVSTADASRS